MKTQSDLIVTVVAVLCMLIGVGVFFGTKREAVKPTPPEAVVQAPLQMPAANVVMASSLPGASNAGGGGAAMGAGGRGGFGGGPSALGGPGRGGPMAPVMAPGGLSAPGG